tara:strand:- start:3286 stop:3501 length:216 start_codon:yes stop_codon:yes gene_type:complete
MTNKTDRGKQILDELAYNITDKLFWIFIENSNPKTINDFIEPDPDNPDGTRNTERGRELFEELEEFVRNTL